jgi:hypothetical protein
VLAGCKGIHISKDTLMLGGRERPVCSVLLCVAVLIYGKTSDFFWVPATSAVGGVNSTKLLLLCSNVPNDTTLRFENQNLPLFYNFFAIRANH